MSACEREREGKETEVCWSECLEGVKSKQSECCQRTHPSVSPLPQEELEEQLLDDLQAKPVKLAVRNAGDTPDLAAPDS